MLKRSLMAIASGMAISIGFVTSAAADSIVTNGDFEVGDFTGWSVERTDDRQVRVLTEGEFTSPCCQASGGASFVNFNGGNSEPAGSLSQDLMETISGKLYRLTFDFAKGGTGSGTAALDVTVQDTDTDSELLAATVNDSTGAKPGPYSSFEYFFTAAGANTRLIFTDASVGTNSFDAQLDNVKIVAVPEPVSALALLSVGAIAIGSSGRKQRSA